MWHARLGIQDCPVKALYFTHRNPGSKGDTILRPPVFGRYPIARSLIEQGVAEALPGDPYGPLMAEATEAAVSGLTKQLGAVINKALEGMGKAQGKSRKNAVPLIC